MPEFNTVQTPMSSIDNRILGLAPLAAWPQIGRFFALTTTLSTGFNKDGAFIYVAFKRDPVIAALTWPIVLVT